MAVSNFSPTDQVYFQDFQTDSALNDPVEVQPELHLDSQFEDNEYPWFSYSEHDTYQTTSSPTHSPSNSSQETETTRSKDHISGSDSNEKTLKALRLNRRREQNRTSQQKFREKNRKAFDAVAQALEAERQVSSGLRDEVIALHSTIECLARGNQNCLEMVSRLCKSLHKFPEAAAELEIAGLNIGDDYKGQDTFVNTL